VAVADPNTVGEPGLVEAMLGKTVGSLQGRASEGQESAGPVVLDVKGLSSGDHVKGIDLTLRAGEILGVAALEGQGQERLFALLSGDRRPDSGEIKVNGESLSARSPFDAVRKGVVLIPSDRLQALLPQRSIRENLGTPLYRSIPSWFSIASDEKERVARAVERLSIDTRAGRQAGRLSGGNQQKVVVGRWLAAGFRVLLCFDPTRGIDVGTKHQIYELLSELAADGAAILVYTSELAEIPLVCDRALVMYDGRIVAEQPGATATEQSLLTAAHGLSRDQVA
jgi:ribose transport system ATP-binding protein